MLNNKNFGKIYMTNLTGIINTNTGLYSRVIIINENTSTVTVIPVMVTDKVKYKSQCNIEYDERRTVLVDQMRVINKNRLFRCVGELIENKMADLQKAIKDCLIA